MKKLFTQICAVTAACVLTATASAETGKVAMLVASTDVDALNAQEKAAASYFTKQFSNGELVSVDNASVLTTDNYDAVWVHVDRCGISAGVENLPDGFASEAVTSALKSYLNNGGNIYLSKHATQLTTALGRIPANYAPGIVGTGDGGNGKDVWTIQAIIGAMNDANNFPDADPGREFDATQVYDHTGHAIYAGLATLPAGHQYANFVTATFPMEGTGDGSEMWREDHNCMWDLNAYQYAAEGKNTTEKFEKDFNAVVLGTWGHVQDYCVAGIVEFKPENEGGTLIANGLAACEWAPRNGGNAYHDNLEKLTTNTLNYLAAKAPSGVDKVMVNDEAGNAEVEYYTISGMRVSNSAVVPGIYIVRQGSKVSKQVVK